MVNIRNRPSKRTLSQMNLCLISIEQTVFRNQKETCTRPKSTKLPLETNIIVRMDLCLFSTVATVAHLISVTLKLRWWPMTDHHSKGQ